MERRVLIAIFLSFLVVYGYQTFFTAPAPKPAPAEQAAPADAAVATPPAAAGTASAAPAAAALVGEPGERDVRVETTHVVAVFTNRGARLKSWKLKNYRDSKGQPLELVDQAVA